MPDAALFCDLSSKYQHVKKQAAPYSKKNKMLENENPICYKLATRCINEHWGTVILGVALWGIHMGMTQGLLATMIANSAPANLRGTAYGFFNLLTGLAMLIASALAGLIWDKLGASFTFYVGAIFCVLGLLGLTQRTSDIRD